MILSFAIHKIPLKLLLQFLYFHYLLLNKPRGGNYHWIDNHMVRATKFKGKFTDLIKVKKEIEVFKK